MGKDNQSGTSTKELPPITPRPGTTARPGTGSGGGGSSGGGMPPTRAALLQTTPSGLRVPTTASRPSLISVEDSGIVVNGGSESGGGTGTVASGPGAGGTGAPGTAAPRPGAVRVLPGPSSDDSGDVTAAGGRRKPAAASYNGTFPPPPPTPPTTAPHSGVPRPPMEPPSTPMRARARTWGSDERKSPAHHKYGSQYKKQCTTPIANGPRVFRAKTAGDRKDVIKLPPTISGGKSQTTDGAKSTLSGGGVGSGVVSNGGGGAGGSGGGIGGSGVVGVHSRSSAVGSGGVNSGSISDQVARRTPVISGGKSPQISPNKLGGKAASKWRQITRDHVVKPPPKPKYEFLFGNKSPLSPGNKSPASPPLTGDEFEEFEKPPSGQDKNSAKVPNKSAASKGFFTNVLLQRMRSQKNLLKDKDPLDPARVISGLVRPLSIPNLEANSKLLAKQEAQRKKQGYDALVFGSTDLKEKRILDWLRVVEQEAERPDTPQDIVDDEPRQTDTAIHVVYGGD